MRNSLLIACLFLSSSFIFAEEPIPEYQGRVTDKTDTLTSVELQSLETTLEAFEKRKGSQVVVLIVATTGEETIEQYSIRVAEKWKIGRKKIDDGVILLVAKDDRKLRIEVGYGLEGVLTDVFTKRIIDEQIVPRFKQNEFSSGISEGVKVILSTIDGEELPPPVATETEMGPWERVFIGGFLSIFIVVGLLIPFVVNKLLSLIPLIVSSIAGGIVWTLSQSWFATMFSVAWVAFAAGVVTTIFGGIASGASRRGSGSSSGGFSSGWSSGSSSSSSSSGGGGSFGGGGSSGSW